MKISFKNDYSEGCHPLILKALTENNFTQQAGYGHDQHTQAATRLIIEKLQSAHSQVYYVSGGTQANLLTIAALLRPYESVIAARTAHIADNEAGAIEAVGHKIHLLDTDDGKITPEKIKDIATRFTNFPHQVKPRLVFISNATELGTAYQRQELEALRSVCDECGLLLYMDGARLGQAMQATDLQWFDLPKLTDVFYIGATKNGALLGEAIVINRPELQQGFEYHSKQKGALLAKSRLIGIQFQQLMGNGLYEQLAELANKQAQTIRKAFEEKGISFWDL